MLGAFTKMKALKAVKIVVFVPVLFLSCFFRRDYWAPDGCLDFGGSFDYVKWECNYEVTQKYIDVPFYKIKTFWLVPLSVLFATIVLAYLRKQKNGT